MSATINRKALSAFIQQCLDPLPDAVLVDTHHNQLMRKARAEVISAIPVIAKRMWRERHMQQPNNPPHIVPMRRRA